MLIYIGNENNVSPSNWPLMHLQPFYKNTFGFKKGMFPKAEAIEKGIVLLPFSESLTDGQAGNVAGLVLTYCAYEDKFEIVNSGHIKQIADLYSSPFHRI